MVQTDLSEDSFQLTEDTETQSILVDRTGSNMATASEDTSRISTSKASQWVRELLEDPKNRLALSALSTADPKTVLQQPTSSLANIQVFNTAIPFEGAPVTNQKSSGRCWIFAATNVFRVAIQKKYNIENFELSQSYLFFWDKVEKSNHFLEQILDTADEGLDSRIVAQLMLDCQVGDGGQWDMIVNLVNKYGLIPQVKFPDSWSAQNSSTMDTLLMTKLRENALRLRALKKEKSAGHVAAAKDEMMKEIVRILTLTLGAPPPADGEFTWEFRDKEKKFHTYTFTPLSFADALHDSEESVDACGGTDVFKLFSLTNDPRNDYNTLLTVDRLGNVWGGRPTTYVNVEQKVMKQACIEMIKRGFPVFFGSDVGKFSDTPKGIMDTGLVDYELGFGIKLGMTKAERLRSGESLMTHAMVLTAVHLDDDGEPVRWRVENSWSKTAGTEGYFVMSDKWMDEFCYQAVVDPSVVSKEVRDVLEQKAKVLPLWDPMGALA